MGNRIGNVDKPRCFNGFQVALNMLKAAFWSPAEPTWDFKVCAASRSEGHFAGGGWLPTGVPAVIIWNRPTARLARFPTSGRAENASCSFFLEKFFVLVFRGSQGRSSSRVQEGLSILPPIHPRIPPMSRIKRSVVRRLYSVWPAIQNSGSRPVPVQSLAIKGLTSGSLLRMASLEKSRNR